MRIARQLRWVWFCAWLTACASAEDARRDATVSSVEQVLTWEDACEDERSLAVLCGDDACAFVRCRDARGLAPGEVVRVRGGAVVAPAAPGAPRRWWGRGLGLPGDSEPVFIIPWNNFSNPHRLQPEMRRMLPQRPWVLHHIFPQEPRLAAWFARQRIDIHRYTIPIPQSLHTYLHSGGPRGGLWNEAWRQFARAHPEQEVPHEVIWRHALELMMRYKLTGPLVPYR
ncbi:TIGR02269 family lipoprotein [Myxococcaceae bacterium GXIMD 01537]